MIWFKNQQIIQSKVKTTVAIALTFGAIYCASRYSFECSKGIIQGISFCFDVLIPSLFVYMIIASYISNSKIANLCSKLFSGPAEKLFSLPAICSSVMLLSIIGGYPVGATATACLYKNRKINKSQAQKTALMAVCAGPGFTVNFVGCALYKSNRAGVILLVSQIIAFFLTALIIGKTIKIDTNTVLKKEKEHTFSTVDAVQSGCKSTANMCGMVVAFCAVSAVCDAVFKNTVIKDIIKALLEVTTACNTLFNRYPLYIISFIVGFAGICVHFQIFSILKDVDINKLLFFLFRILQGIIAGCLTYILLILFPLTSQVFSTTSNVQPNISSSVWGTSALILTAVCFLNSISNTKFIRR